MANQETSYRHSFSGSDIQCSFLFRTGREGVSHFSGQPRGQLNYDWSTQLQTLTVSSMRTLGPVRVLGETPVRGYVRGPRTLAGTMVFSLIDDDPFARFYQIADQELLSYQPFFVDQVPEFDIVIYGETEFLETRDRASSKAGVGNLNEFLAGEPPATAVLLDCTLANFGTTFSVNDMMLEATYTYEARGFLPWVRDPNSIISAHRTRNAIRENVLRASELEPTARRVRTSESALADFQRPEFIDPTLITPGSPIFGN